MENPTVVLSPSSSGRRRSSSASNSPEFEFWMLRNPNCPQTLLHSADELFSGGVLLPLHQLNTQNSDDPPNKTTTTATDPNPGPVSDPETALIAPKRWKDMFKKNPEKEKKKKERNGGGGGGTGVAELNINLWPFSRSRSAGNAGGRGGTRPPAATGRKASSAPCSRSNSAGESKSSSIKKWQTGSPSRGGVHVGGRSSPVWQMKRVGSGRTLHDNLLVRNAAEKGGLKKEKPETRRSKKGGAGGGGGDTAVGGSGVGAKVKVLNLNVQTCIGYRHHLGCRSDEIREGKSIRVVAGGNAGVETSTAGVLPGGEGPRGGNMFNLRNLFAKKVY